MYRQAFQIMAVNWYKKRTQKLNLVWQNGYHPLGLCYDQECPDIFFSLITNNLGIWFKLCWCISLLILHYSISISFGSSSFLTKLALLFFWWATCPDSEHWERLLIDHCGHIFFSLYWQNSHAKYIENSYIYKEQSNKVQRTVYKQLNNKV